MEQRPPDTMPLPVVETVAAPGPPPTEAMPVEPAAPPPLPPAPPARRDLTPWLLGLLAVGAVLALALSVVALTRDERPAGPTEPAVADVPVTEPPPPSTAASAGVPGTMSPRTTAAPRATAAPADPTAEGAKEQEKEQQKGGDKKKP